MIDFLLCVKSVENSDGYTLPLVAFQKRFMENFP